MQFLWRPLFVLSIALFLGWWFDAILIFTNLALGWMVVMHLLNLDHFYEWIRKGNFKRLPSIGEPYATVCRQVQMAYRTQRQRVSELARISRYFESLVAALPEGILILDADGHIEFVNPAAQKFLHLRKADEGRRFNLLVRHEPLQDFIEQETHRPPVFFMDVYKHHKVHLKVSLIDFKDKQKLLIFDDVTSAQNMAQMRREFVSNASHELRTPLTVLVGYLEMLHEPVLENQPDLAQPFEQMQTNAKRMQQILEDLMQLSQIENNETAQAQEVFDLSVLAQEAAQMMQSLGGQTHRIHVQIKPGLKMKGQASEIYSAMTNLMTNAVRYTPAGGEIWVRLDLKLDGLARFSVKDTGIGIETEHLERLTERFYRVDTARSRATGGTGLGLAIVKHALENHQSYLQIRSQPGQGSEFYFDLPGLV